MFDMLVKINMHKDSHFLKFIIKQFQVCVSILVQQLGWENARRGF